MNWFQDISMCIDSRQSMQLCPYHMGYDQDIRKTVHTYARSKMPQYNIVNIVSTINTQTFNSYNATIDNILWKLLSCSVIVHEAT